MKNPAFAHRPSGSRADGETHNGRSQPRHPLLPRRDGEQTDSRRSQRRHRIYRQKTPKICFTVSRKRYVHIEPYLQILQASFSRSTLLFLGDTEALHTQHTTDSVRAPERLIKHSPTRCVQPRPFSPEAIHITLTIITYHITASPHTLLLHHLR